MHKRDNKAAIAAAMLFGLIAGIHEPAEADTTQMTVQAQVPAVCRIENASILDFGEVDNAFGNDTDGSATVEWRCTRNTTASVAIDDGAGGGREMVSVATATPLAYELFQNPARDLRWGSASESVSVTGTGMNNGQPLTVYGRVVAADAESADPADDYTDTVTISITW